MLKSHIRQKSLMKPGLEIQTTQLDTITSQSISPMNKNKPKISSPPKFTINKRR